MGIKAKSFTSVKKLKLDFISSQSHWGHHKQILNHSLNSYFLGVKNDFTLFNPEYFIEFSKRCAIFCSNIISNDGQILFINSNNDNINFNSKFNLSDFKNIQQERHKKRLEEIKAKQMLEEKILKDKEDEKLRLELEEKIKINNEIKSQVNILTEVVNLLSINIINIENSRNMKTVSAMIKDLSNQMTSYDKLDYILSEENPHKYNDEINELIQTLKDNILNLINSFYQNKNLILRFDRKGQSSDQIKFYAKSIENHMRKIAKIINQDDFNFEIEMNVENDENLAKQFQSELNMSIEEDDLRMALRLNESNNYHNININNYKR